MAINLFGVTVDSVRRHHFPNADAWVTSSRPSSTTVAEAIDEEAARLAGALNSEAIDASAITTDSVAYLSCRKILRMMVAICIAQDMTGTEPKIVSAWKKTVGEFMDGLEEGSATFLGDGASSSGTSEPDGPTDFISENSLEIGDSADMSDVKPELQRKDQF